MPPRRAPLVALPLALLLISGCSDPGSRASTSGAGTFDSGISTAPGEDGTQSGGEGESMSEDETQSGGEGESMSEGESMDEGEDDATKFDMVAFDDLDPLPEGPIPATCGQAAQGTSTVGCRFFAVDLDTHDAAELVPFAVAVSNVQENADAVVTIERKQGGNWSAVAGPMALGPLSLATLELPDLHQDGSGKRVGGAYRITADVPIVAYQFNPVDGATSFLSDASMLYPSASWDHINEVVGWQPNEDSFGIQGAYATIVAAHDGTLVEVVPSVLTVGAGGVPAGQPGVPFTIDLDEGDIAEVMTTLAAVTLSGTRITSDAAHPVGVFSGHECAFVPASVEACDHLEEQLAGVRMWGTHFIASRVPPRVPNYPEAATWQFYATEDNTQIQLSAHAEVIGLPFAPITLQAGQMLPIYVRGSPANPGDFEVQSTKPIALIQYMVGGEPYNGIGDPAMVQMGPVEQLLTRYVVLVPGTWINDVAVITRQAGASVSIDGAPVPNAQFLAVADGAYEVARVTVADGVHVLDGGGDPFGVVIVGYDEYDSYAYPGGIGTDVINPAPG